MPMIDIAGESFHVRSDGPDDAPVLMLSNSLSSTLAMWDPQIPAFSRHFRVVRYDSRGHGQSPAPDRPYSISELGRDALAIMDALKLDRVNWCGLSKGGMVGQWLLTHAPDRLGRVILANTAAQMGPPDLWNGRVRTVRNGSMAAIVDGTLERWFSPAFRASAPDTMVTIRRMILATPPQGYCGCAAAIRDMDQREAIRAAANPVLVIVGAHDPATMPAAGQLIHERIRGSRLVTLEAAHLSNVEQPKAFATAALDFLME